MSCAMNLPPSLYGANPGVLFAVAFPELFTMAEAELIEQLRAQVMSLKSPRHATPGHGTNDSESTGWVTVQALEMQPVVEVQE